jgi:hypothetical protein
MQKPSIGRTVLYTLSEQDAAAITAKRNFGLPTGVSKIGSWNSVQAGDVYPATVVRVWDVEGSTPSCNLQVHLDGPDNFWALSRFQFGTRKELQNESRESTWDWPPRV